MKTIAQVTVSNKSIVLNGNVVDVAEHSLNGMYRSLIGDYPKFFKMDALCKLGFIAAELLLRDFTTEEKENAAIALFNRNGSLITDRNYQKTIASADNYFPSPALFVYTLANIVTGEIAIRHKIYGESSFYILDSNDDRCIDEVASDIFLTSSPTMVLTGWVDYEDDNNFIANMKIITK